MGKGVNRPKKGMLKHFSEGFANEDGYGAHFWGDGETVSLALLMGSGCSLFYPRLLLPSTDMECLWL